MNKNSKFLVENFAFQIAKAFDIQTLSEHTGLSRTSCFVALKELEKEGKVRVNTSERRHLYLYQERREKQVIKEKKSCSPSERVIEQVREYTESEKTHKEIAQELGISRSSVSMAVKSLKQMGIIENPPPTPESIYACRRETLRRLLKLSKIDYNRDIQKMTLDDINKEIKRIRGKRNELLRRSTI